jgi:excisionase family DNA binding protein
MARRYHTPKEVAEILAISDDAVLDLINRGDLPGIRISPRITRIPIAAFDRWREGYRPTRQRIVIRRARRETTVGEGETLPIAPALSHRMTKPTLPLFASNQPDLAERVDEDLGGFGER